MKRLGLHRPVVVISCAALVCLSLGSGPPAAAQEAPSEDAAKASLTLESLRVTPERPKEETLCRLAVTLANQAERPVSALAFEVLVGGQALPVYQNQLFVEAIAAGASTEVQLFNFWTSETGRPLPAGETLEVKVRLVEARWLAISTDEDGTEVWDLGEQVPGLPLETSVKVPLDRPKPKAPASAESTGG